MGEDQEKHLKVKVKFCFIEMKFKHSHVWFSWKSQSREHIRFCSKAALMTGFKNWFC